MPIIPDLKNSITRQKIAPRMYCHMSTSAPELRLYSQRLIKNVPITAPKIVPLPPTATQITIVIENAIVICVGVIEPLKFTNRAPPIADIIAEMT